MKAIYRIFMSLALIGAATSASAQYYELANQVSNLISPALSGSFKYKGFVDVSGIAGFGDNRANFIGASTVQGFQYASWFFMGAGLGIDVAMTPGDYVDYRPGTRYREASRVKAMIPMFTDFRFNIGNSEKSPSAFIDIKMGATWLLGDSDLALANGTMGGGAQFYLKPSVGVRIPISASNPRQAVNVGITYQLITSNSFYTAGNGRTSLNGFGATIAFEW